jgi:two-component system, OmpR family, sensor kinase
MPDISQETDERFNDKRFHTLLTQLLSIETNDTREALGRAALLVAQTLRAEKTDIFLYDADIQSLIALGISDTDLGKLQKSLGLDRLPIANEGRTVEVFKTGHRFRHGHLDQDTKELPGLSQGMGVRSAIAVPLPVGEERRGVLQADTTQVDFFSEEDLTFLEDVAHWVGIVVHRAELLEQVYRDTQEANRRLTAEELVTVLAHDIRNQLTPIKARLGLLERRASRDKRDNDLRDLEGINATMQRFEHLISDLMDTARLSQGLFSLSWTNQDLITIVEQVARTLRTPEVIIRMQTPQHVSLWIDADRLQQALENLLANAVRHSPSGGTVTIKVEQREDAIAIIIQDEGSGIPPEILPRLFLPFQAGPGSIGLGLGLYLASQIVKAHGGSLAVQATSAQGTSFLLLLPKEKQRV